MADRYEVLGYVPQEREDNRSLDPQDQRVAEDQVVYTTDDKDEAERMRLAGGFVQGDPDEGQWTVVTGWRDTQKEPADGSGSGAPKKGDFAQ